MSENMNNIIRINGQSRISYGKIVEQRYFFGIEKPVQKTEKKNLRKCSVCGNMFEPEVLHDGTLSRKDKCEDCCYARRIETNRNAWEKRRAERKTEIKKERKVYQRECAQCGAIVETKQPPRGTIPIYCPECRKNRNRDAARERYRKGKKVCKQ